jgi:plastocyanin
MRRLMTYLKGVSMQYAKKEFFIWIAIMGFLLGADGLATAEQQEHLIVIRGHQFFPAELVVAANQKIKIVIENHDATAEEFESYDLRREKVVSGNGKITLYIGPLKAGTYKFFGEFHPASAQGKIIVQ